LRLFFLFLYCFHSFFAPLGTLIRRQLP
jgi:hypothetical protein